MFQAPTRNSVITIHFIKWDSCKYIHQFTQRVRVHACAQWMCIQFQQTYCDEACHNKGSKDNPVVLFCAGAGVLSYSRLIWIPDVSDTVFNDFHLFTYPLYWSQKYSRPSGKIFFTQNAKITQNLSYLPRCYIYQYH